MDGTQPGDPRKAAAAILAKHERLRADLDTWEALSRDTAVDGRAG